MKTFFKTISNTIRPWYIPLTVGLLLIALGICIFTVPLETYLALSIFFTVSFIAPGLWEIFRTNNIVCSCNINLKNPYTA